MAAAGIRMKTLISLLRGINVSGQNRVRMPELKVLYESLNLSNVVTYIQSGNVIFDCTEQDPAELARVIETELEHVLGVSAQVLLRDINQLVGLIKNNPFINQRNEDPDKLYVTFLADAPGEAVLRNLPANGRDCFATPALPKEPRENLPGGAREERLAMTLDPGAAVTDEFCVNNQEIYLFCPNGYGRTKLSNSFFERKLSVTATTRNWKTVNILYEMATLR
jgi:uncharacterized protein (DUF1697 family)